MREEAARSPGPGSGLAADAGPAPSDDLLRLEYFGGLHYSRRTAEFTALTPAEAGLLLGARRRPLPRAWAALDPEDRLPEDQLLARTAAWRREGLLDDALVCRARVVPRRWPEAILTGPLVTHLQLTRTCNLECSHCFVEVTRRPPPGELSLARLDALFGELAELGAPRVVLAGGEPLLRPDAFEIFEALRARGLDAWLCTNATLVRPETARRLARAGLRGVQVSLDGPDAETHDAVRGRGQFARARQGLEALLAAGAPGVEVRVTVNALNAPNLQGFGELARALGVPKTSFKPFRRTGASAQEHRLAVGLPAYQRAVERALATWPQGAGQAHAGDGLSSRTPRWMQLIPEFGCVGGTVSATVTAQGAVVACGSVLEPGDWRLAEHAFADAWRGAPNLSTWRTLAGNSACRACHHYARCGGGCRARAFAAGAGLSGQDPWSHCAHPLETMNEGPTPCDSPGW